MDFRSPRPSSLLSSPFSSPNVASLLKIKILSWSQETGFPVCVCVRIGNRTFNLHKHPFISKSGFFNEKLQESNNVELPPNFPGGAETFEMIALFLYGSSTLVDPFNVASLRCAAEYLRMTEEYGAGNLCERFDIYLNQVVLQRWNDTLIVLQKCQSLLPWAEYLLIVSRCIETLAFMACMEILDPERRRDQPVITMEALASKPWSDQTVNNIVSQDLWIKDLIALPLEFFKRVIGSLRRQGMKEKYVSPIILFYADKWVISTSKGNDLGIDESITNLSIILQGVIDLLPVVIKATSPVPVGFYFSLLSVSIELGLRNDYFEKLQSHIVPWLHLAQVKHFLQPNGANELRIMESLFLVYFSCNMELDCTTVGNNYHAVTESWDMYLVQIATNSNLSCERFVSLIETVPMSMRQLHDHLYRALDTFLESHPNLPQGAKEMVCKYLNCQKLSQEVCIEAVQNELMPLRLIVQALFVQQLNTQQAFRECSDSFRYAHCEEFSGSLSSSRCPNSRSHILVESPYINGSEGGCYSRSLSLLLQKDSWTRRPERSSEISRKDYESTSFRIQNLEQELMSLKRNHEQDQMASKTKKMEGVSECVANSGVMRRRYELGDGGMSKKQSPLGQVATCVGNVRFGSHRKYANKLVKALQRMRFWGRSRRKAGVSVSPMSM